MSNMDYGYFYINLNLNNVGLDPHKGEKMINIVTNANLKEVFGKECIG